jgi:hypothetical protein
VGGSGGEALVAEAAVGLGCGGAEGGEAVRRGLVVVSGVLFLVALALLYGLVPDAAEEAVEAYRYVVVALLTGATVLLIVAAVTAHPPQ